MPRIGGCNSLKIQAEKIRPCLSVPFSILIISILSNSREMVINIELYILRLLINNVHRCERFELKIQDNAL